MNHERSRYPASLTLATLILAAGTSLAAQDPQPADVHEHVAVTAEMLTPTRESVGTGWLPVATPMFGLHEPWRGWDVRVDGAVFVAAIYEPGDRHRTGGPGERQVAGLNWGMGMLRRPIGDGRVGLRTMLSAEPATSPNCGALSYLATGEACEGDTIHDRQQAHDLVMELAADYDRPLAGHWRWQVYGGLAGEPALGPPAYAHRPSSRENFLQPIAHHWLDSTSTAFGVVTLGVFNQRWKYEASAFHGRDADESRVDLDLGALDSYSARVSVLPTQHLALQVSAGRVKEVDFVFQTKPAATKVTASAIVQRSIGTDGQWATTLAYGYNKGPEVVNGLTFDISSHAALLESTMTINRNVVFGRAELVAMPAHHLHAHEYFEQVFNVGKVQLGYTRRLGVVKRLMPGIGVSAALSLLPDTLAPRYSGNVARSLQVFLNLLPARHVM